MKKILFAVPVAACVAGLLALTAQTAGSVTTPVAPAAEVSNARQVQSQATGATVQMTEWLQTADSGRPSKYRPN